MQDYRPTPRMGRRLKRLEELTALRRPLTDDEQREVLWLANRARQKERLKRRYAEDAEYRERERQRSLAYWHQATGAKERQAARRRERYASDPAYREHRRAQSRAQCERADS